jgi:uncharacterized membrane protein (UPF0182 family)
MENLLNSIDSQGILLAAAVVVAILSFSVIGKVLKVAFGQIMALAVIVLVLNYGLGISPRQLWFEVSHLPTTLMRFMQNFG